MNNTCETTVCSCNRGRTGFVFILVLYILLAIIIGGNNYTF
ncbi:MAG: sporulation protein YjcZ [Bacilli bacterium]|nr:sporulation protein YjcZ [Bacilli bacterium]